MSLLSYLFPRIKGSQEDVATLALEYILNQDDRLAREFTTLACKALNVPSPKDQIIFKPQAVGKNKERPDMAGYDSAGKEVFLFEHKFYASLTPNQPNGYLERLQQKSGLGLVFICPKARLSSLFSQLLSLCPDATKATENCFVSMTGIPVALLSWFEVLDALKVTAEKINPILVSDIDQLKDFCGLIDRDEYPAFEPEDFSADMPKKMERYQAVIIKVAERILNDQSRHADSNGLTGASSRDGYVRYLHMGDYTLTLRYSRSLWANPNLKDTPFWFGAELKGKSGGDLFSELPVSSKDKAPDPQYGTMLYAMEPENYLPINDTADDLLRKFDNLFTQYYTAQREKAGE